MGSTLNEERQKLLRKKKTELVDAILDADASALGETKSQIKRALRESEARYRQLYNKTPVMMHSIDSIGRLVQVNDHWLSVMGYDRDEVTGRKSVDFLTPESKKYAQEVILPEFFRQGFINNIHYQLIKKSGDVIDVLLSAKADYDEDGNVVSSFADMVDVTELRQAQAALEKATLDAQTANRSKTTFLANMSHELRTPLNAIIGFSDSIRRQTFGPIGDSRYLEYLDHISDSGHHLLGIISDILDVSAIESDKLDLHETTVKVVNIVQSVYDMVLPRAEQTSVNVSIDSGNATTACIRVDERRIKQALLNLLTNAINFTPKNGSVALSASITGSGDLSMMISDTGVGMSADEVETVKIPFGRTDNSHERNKDGVGLGIPLTIGLIESHGGKIDFDSEPGRGTKVTILIPKERVL